MTAASIKKALLALTDKERRKLLPELSDEDFQQLLKMDDRKFAEELHRRLCLSGVARDEHSHKKKRWFDQKIKGLSQDGREQLKALQKQMQDPVSAFRVDRKRVRYLEQLQKMKLSVPDSFRNTVSPKMLYRQLASFCREHDIPEEIVHRMVPALVSYMETGYMRPIIFWGEKGCGKTTAVRLLVEEALKIPTEIIKIPQTDGGHGLCGDCGIYQSADAGALAKARLRANSLLTAYIFDEIDKVTHDRNRASVDDELLSVTDESCDRIVDNYLETDLVGLEYCPKFMTANDLRMVSPVLADRCTVIHFPNASADRIKSISRKYVDKKLENNLYAMIKFDYGLMNTHIDHLIRHDITSLRRHQQMIEAVLDNALEKALVQESDETVVVTETMFADAEKAFLGSVKKQIGFVKS